MDWIDLILNELKKQNVGKNFLEFILNNRDLLYRIGKDRFTSFLNLVLEKKDEEAFSLLLSVMTPDDIIEKMENNATDLASINKQQELLILNLYVFVKKYLTPIAIKILIGILL
jgi:hypothetical protein